MDELEMFRFSYKKLLENYKKSNLVMYGRPDMFQYHQNELNQSIAEFLLQPYWNKILKIPEIDEFNERTEK